jgi:hypothetical protein
MAEPKRHMDVLERVLESLPALASSSQVQNSKPNLSACGNFTFRSALLSTALQPLQDFTHDR